MPGRVLEFPFRFFSALPFWKMAATFPLYCVRVSLVVVSAFFPALTGMIGFWATLSLNIPDFSRYARSQRDQIIGQTLGLPLTMALYAFIGVAVTSATTIIYGQTIWDPTDVLARFKNPVLLLVAMLALCIATLATNIAANVVSPANDFSQIAPRKISFFERSMRAADVCRSISQNFSPAGATSPFVARAIPTGGGPSVAPVSGR